MTLQVFARVALALLFLSTQFFPLVHVALEHANGPETCGHDSGATHFCTGLENGDSSPCQVCVTAQGVNLAEALARTVEVARVSEQPVGKSSSFISKDAFAHLPRSRGPPAGL